MKKLIAIVLMAGFMLGLASTALAANQNFTFTLKNSGQTYHVYTSTSNKKVNLTDPATIRSTSTSGLQGYGMSLNLCRAQVYTVATVSVWCTGLGIRHPSYLSGQAAINVYYQAAGRIDDAYAGPMTVSGKYNADNTTGY